MKTLGDDGSKKARSDGQCWFLNRDHLITNILSTQKDESGHLMWVDFQPTFHTHLVWQALTLVPPLCPIAKGKRYMFVFVLEVLDGNGPGPSEPGSFFALPKKRSRSLPKCKTVSTTPAPSAPTLSPLSGPSPSTPMVAAPSPEVPPLELLAFLPPSSSDVFVSSMPFPCLSPIQMSEDGPPF